MLSFPRFDLSESSYAFLLLDAQDARLARVYVRILDELIRRHTTYWAAVDWLTQIDRIPIARAIRKAYRRLIPKDLWGHYDVPGWPRTASSHGGSRPTRSARPAISSSAASSTDARDPPGSVGRSTWDSPFEMAGLEDRTFSWTHRASPTTCAAMGEDAARTALREHQGVAFCLSAAGLGLQLTDRTLGTETHWVYDRWVDETFKKKLLGFDGRGKLKWVRSTTTRCSTAVTRQPRPRPLPVALRRSAEPRSASCSIGTRSRRSAGASGTCHSCFPAATRGR
jgi:hypothetical protein